MENSLLKTMENSFTSPLKVKHTFLVPYDPAVPHLSIHPREIETCSYKSLYTEVHKSIIYNYQKLGTT